MPVNNYLVMGVAPANGEKNVSLDQNVTILFQKNMLESSLSKSNIRLRKVNGPEVESTFTYNNMEKRLTVTPTNGLEASTSYVLEIVGGASGIVSVIDEYLSSSKQYGFQTKEESPVLAPTNVIAVSENRFVSASWENPSISTGYMYDVKLSSSNLADNDGIWPEQNHQTITSRTIDFPKRLEPGSYYIHVRTRKDQVVSSWTTTMVAIEEELPETEVPESGGEPEPGTDTWMQVKDSYPKKGGYAFEGLRMGLLFSLPLKEQDFGQLVRLSPTGGNSFFGDEDVALTIARQEGKEEVLVINLSAPLEAGKRYELTVSKEIASVLQEGQEMLIEGNLVTVPGEEKTLAQDYVVSFIAAGEYVYASVEEVKNELPGILRDAEDLIVYEQIIAASQAAYLIASSSPRFDEALFADGQFPFYMKQYVKYKVAYDMAIGTMMSSSSTKDKDIRLGDLAVGESSKESQDFSIPLKEYKAKLKLWEDMLHGVTGRGYATMKSAVFAETGSPYPDFFEGIAEYPELGG